MLALFTTFAAILGIVIWLLLLPPIEDELTSSTQNEATEEQLPIYPGEKPLDEAASEIVPDQPSSQGDPNTFIPTPEPIRIPSGRVGFTVSGGKPDAPQFGRGYVDPYDPEEGQTQSFEISVSSQSPVTSVKAVIETDNQEQTIKMTLIEGANTQGVWKGSWTVNDSYLYTYNLALEADNEQGTQQTTITLR